MKVYEFSSHIDFEEAFRRLEKHEPGLEVYSFLPEDELIERLNLKQKYIPVLAVTGAILGVLAALAIQSWPNLFTYPMNIGGKPLFSWPAFLIVMFELGILASALCVVAGLILGNGLPRYDREIFNLPAYAENRHQHFFILTLKEYVHVKALAIHDLPDTPE